MGDQALISESLLVQRSMFFVVGRIFLIFIVRLVQNRDLDLRYAIAWFPLGIIVILLSIFPSGLLRISEFFGFQLPSNAVMSMAILLLLFLVFLQGVAMGRAKKDIRDLCQQMALLEESLRNR